MSVDQKTGPSDLGSASSLHTAGPWAIARLADGTPRWVRAENANICHLSDEANARLIASAPDMYEALKGAREEIQRFAKMYVGNRQITSALDLRLKAITAALAKATGGQS